MMLFPATPLGLEFLCEMELKIISRLYMWRWPQLDEGCSESNALPDESLRIVEHQIMLRRNHPDHNSPRR